MKKFNWLLVMLLLALVPALQSCDDDGYSIGRLQFVPPVAVVIIWKVIVGV